VLLLGAVRGVSAAPPALLTGSLGGQVKSAAGIAQMGATVILYNRYDRIVRHALTNPDGSFQFDSLLPDQYSVRVTLSSFLPAFRRNVSVQPGFHSVLTINLSSMLSSIEFVAGVPTAGSLMSDDWKWVLRSSQGTRPVLRFDPLKSTLPAGRPAMSNVFSETRGIVRVSAGDGTSFSAMGTQPDLGTAFAVATSLFGSNQLEFSGNFGYSSHTGLPAGGFRTRYSRNGGSQTPEITLAMHQVYLPARGGFSGGGQDGPSLRVMSATMLNEFAFSNAVLLEYGSSIESISLLTRLNRVSPFARLTYDLGNKGSLRLAYSAGAPAAELASRGGDQAHSEESSAGTDFVGLGMFPRVSMRNSVARVQRTENLELGFTKTAGSRTYRAGIFHERVSNGAAMLAGAGDMFQGDILPDLGSESAIFNLGKYQRWGYAASLTQHLGERIETSLAYGRGGALTTEGRELNVRDADELRRFIKVHERNWASARVAAKVPRVGTRLGTSYGWVDRRSMMPGHLYLAQNFSSEPGLNFTLRQPLPAVTGNMGRLEATAELRNLLQQGYLPVSIDGRMLLFTNAPRALRGGLSFIF
jgi:hypothetical protein